MRFTYPICAQPYNAQLFKRLLCTAKCRLKYAFKRSSCMQPIQKTAENSDRHVDHRSTTTNLKSNTILPACFVKELVKTVFLSAPLADTTQMQIHARGIAPNQTNTSTCKHTNDLPAFFKLNYALLWRPKIKKCRFHICVQQRGSLGTKD